MTSHHHHYNHSCICHQHHHNNKTPLITTSSHYCTQINHPEDNHLLNLLTSYLQNQQNETQNPNQTCSCKSQYQTFNVIKQDDHIVLSCLLRKINDLESSLNKFSSFYNQRQDRHFTLRDSAARVIQSHFRSYLVHRSISFRQLKELASIKSSFLSLKSSVSGKVIFPFKLISRKATDLLLQLDSIQGRIDPMIRRSKRSLSRDLVRFLQYIDDCAIKRFDFVAKSTISVSKKPQGFGVVEDRTVEKSKNRMGKIFVMSSEDEHNSVELEDMSDDSEEVSLSSINKRKIGSSKSSNGVSVKGNVVDKNRNVYKVYGNKSDLTSSVEGDDSVDGDDETRRTCRNKVSVKGSGAKTTRVVKTVRFDENGNVYKVFVDDDTSEKTSNGEDVSELEDISDDCEEVRMSSINKRKIGSSKSSNGVGNVVKPSFRKSIVLDKNMNVEDDSVDGDEETRTTCRNKVLVKGSGVKTPGVVKTVRFDEDGNVCRIYFDDDTSNKTSSGEDNEEETVLLSDGKRRNSKTVKMVLVKGSGRKTNCVVKTVRFDENGNICKVYGDTPEPSISEEDDSTSRSNDGNREEKRNRNEVKDIKYVPEENEGFEEDEEEETHSENEVSSSEGSEGDVTVTRDTKELGSNKHNEVNLQKESSMFSPPLPLKMEP